MMIEQPLDYDDIRDHARAAAADDDPICLDESIHSVRAAEEAIALGACRIINIKPGRVGGHAESIRLHDSARGARRAGLARRHARERHRPRAQHPSLDVAQLHAARRHRGEPPLLRRRI